MTSKSSSFLNALLSKAAGFEDQVDSLLRVLEAFESPNLRLILNHFVEAAKVLKVRRDLIKKPQLKPKEIRAALDLINFHYGNTQDVDVQNNGLDSLIGRTISEDQALEFYEKHVEGKVFDKAGREITIGTDGMRHLYKEAGSGDHVVHSDHFQPIRAKRLPWIRWTIQHTSEIYVEEVERPNTSQTWRVFGYVQPFMVPFTDTETGKQRFVRNYLLVIVRRKSKDAPLEFITAYYFDTHEDLLKRLARFEPFYISQG